MHWSKGAIVSGVISDAQDAQFDAVTSSWFTPVVFYPLIELADYADWADSTAVAPVGGFGESSKQDRITVRSVKLDITFSPFPVGFGSTVTPITTWFVSWYVCKLSFQETVNAVLLGGSGLLRYDPVSVDAGFLHQLPLVRFGSRSGVSKFPDNSATEPFSPSFQQYKINKFIPMRMTLKTDEELYLVFAASFGGGLSEDPPPSLTASGHHRSNIID